MAAREVDEEVPRAREEEKEEEVTPTRTPTRTPMRSLKPSLHTAPLPQHSSTANLPHSQPSTATFPQPPFHSLNFHSQPFHSPFQSLFHNLFHSLSHSPPPTLPHCAPSRARAAVGTCMQAARARGARPTPAFPALSYTGGACPRSTADPRGSWSRTAADFYVGGLVDEFVAVREAPVRLPCTIRLESHASASIVIRLHMIAYDCIRLHMIAYDCMRLVRAERLS